jgi:hypothetical protein
MIEENLETEDPRRLYKCIMNVHVDEQLIKVEDKAETSMWSNICTGARITSHISILAKERYHQGVGLLRQLL